MSAGTDHTLTSTPAVRIEPGKVDPSAIERELRRLEEDGDSSERSVRACMSNLIVYCDDEAQADSVPPELKDLVERHPARVLLLVGESAAVESGIAAEISALCYLGSGGRQVCAEHVRLTAGPGVSRRLPATLRPLLVGDLPTALWWATPVPPPEGEILQELSPMADQVLYDSVGWRDPVRGVITVADWSIASRARVSDLAWSRLLPWRRLIAEAFDPAQLPGGIEAIRDIELEHGPHGLPQAWLLIGWLASCLGWQLLGGRMRTGVDIAWDFESKTGAVHATVRRLPEGSPQIREISLRSGAGSAAAVKVVALDAERLSLRIEGSACPESVVSIRAPSRAALVATQLSDRSADPLFRDALATSRDLAKAVLG